MFRSFIPFILASLGFALISWATKMPLFDWQFSEIVTDYSSTCDSALTSHWTTRFGEDLDARNRPSVLENLNITVKRSWSDETLDRISLSLYNGRLLVFFGVMLSIGYMWWFLLQGEQNRIPHIVMAVLFTVVAVFIFFLLTQVVRLAGPAVGQIPYYYEIRHCQGAIAFYASLSNIHYVTLLVLLGSILSEVGMLVMMLHQLRRVVSEQKGIGSI